MEEASTVKSSKDRSRLQRGNRLRRHMWVGSLLCLVAFTAARAEVT